MIILKVKYCASEEELNEFLKQFDFQNREKLPSLQKITYLVNQGVGNVTAVVEYVDAEIEPQPQPMPMPEPMPQPQPQPMMEQPQQYGYQPQPEPYPQQQGYENPQQPQYGYQPQPQQYLSPEECERIADEGKYYYNEVKDYQRAFECFQKAAPGSYRARTNLAYLCYYLGHGTRKNKSKAIAILQECANAGYQPAFEKLQKIQNS